MEIDYSLFDLIYNEYNNKNQDDMVVLDEIRFEQLPEINNIINDFLLKKIDLSVFKTNIDSITKRKPDVWGFSGFSGQMFFNNLYNTAKDKNKLRKVLISSIDLPTNLSNAKVKIRLLEDYVLEIQELYEDRRKAPKTGFIPFFLSFFWQIQDKDAFPTYYNKNILKLRDLGLLEDLSEREIDEFYELFYSITYNFKKYIDSNFKTNLTLYDIEHMIYHFNKGEKIEDKHIRKKSIPEDKKGKTIENLEFVGSYFSNLEQLSRSSDRKDIAIFEEKVGKLFSVMGYDVRYLGQGTGREPDGLALAYNEGYCIIYDVKCRPNGYSIGTDDRAIIEYIKNKKRDYGKRYQKFYFLLVSSEFKSNEMDRIKSIKKNAAIMSVVMISASNLLRLLNLKFKEDLDLDSLEDNFFLRDGVITEDMFL